MTQQGDLEAKYSVVLAGYAPPDMREQLESDLISELMREIPENVGIEPEYMGERLHGWAISDGGSIDGILWTCYSPDGMLDSSLTFLKFEKGDEKCQ